MKSSRYTFFTSLLCASGLSGGLCFCIITSFSVPADRLLLACACVLAALFFSALLLLPKSWIWLLAVAALAGGGLYMLRAQLIESASVLVSAVRCFVEPVEKMPFRRVIIVPAKVFVELFKHPLSRNRADRRLLFELIGAEWAYRIGIIGKIHSFLFHNFTPLCLLFCYYTIFCAKSEVKVCIYFYFFLVVNHIMLW